MERTYQQLIEHHITHHQQMCFMSGPRQAGKTTISLAVAKSKSCYLYLNWDDHEDKTLILQGRKAILAHPTLQQSSSTPPVIVFDEIHKYKHWKQFLKGFYDHTKGEYQIIVTGSAKLNIYRAGADSLMGRYLLFRVHPFSLAECQQQNRPQTLIQPPYLSKTALSLESLMTFGGFPDPLLKQDKPFMVQWKKLRQHQLFREDIRDLKGILDMSQFELTAELLKQQTGQLLNYSSIAKSVRVSADTIRRWIKSLEEFYYCFTIKPWSRNVKRSLIKEPKIYLWNWSEAPNQGAKFENLMACHLLKAVHYWNDSGLGEFGLYFIRDKEKREVDFLITRDHEPWFLVEAKLAANSSISKTLHHFHEHIKPQHAFQVTYDLPFVDKNCFDYSTPIVVSAQTFLSQLV